METEDLLEYFWFYEGHQGGVSLRHVTMSAGTCLWGLGLRKFWESWSFVPYEYG